MSIDLSGAPSDAVIFAMEDGLLSLHKMRLDAGWDVDDIVDTYAVFQKTMHERGLVSKGLPDDGLHTLSGTKSGKGGESNRTQRDSADGEPGESGDPDNPGHDNTLPGGKSKQNKSPDNAAGRAHTKGFGAISPQPPAAPEPGAADPLDNPDPDSGTGLPDPTLGSEGAPEGDWTPHPFTPSPSLPAICGTCGRAIADHVGSPAGTDQSAELAKYVVKVHAHELLNGGVDPRVNPMFKQDFSGDQRRQFAGNGVALPDGSFPIPDEASLHNAVRLVGHAQDPQAAMQHIIERAKTMGMTHALPPAWNVPDAGMEPQPQVPGPGAHGMSPDLGVPGAAPGGQARPPAGGTARPGGAKPQGGMNSQSGAPGQPVAPGANPPKPKSNYPGNAPSAFGKGMASAFKKAFDAGLDESAALEVIDAATDNDMEMVVLRKSTDELRYVMGPVYMPNTEDAHGEWTTADELQKATWDYVATTGGDRKIYLQHSAQPAGEWVGILQWPETVHATMQKSVDGVMKSETTEFPAGTVWMGVRYEPWAWEMVKKGEITGFSMGGWAKRVDAEIARRTR